VTATERRLQNIEEALDPPAAMALWLYNVRQQHPSLRTLVETLSGQPDEAWPLFQLTRQAETATRTRLQGQAAGSASAQPREALGRAERDAVRDAATLWYLFVELNSSFLTEKRALWLEIALMASSYGRWISDTDRHAARFTEGLGATLAEVYNWKRTVATLTERYFQGECPLLAEAEESLQGMVEKAEQLVDWFNDRVEFEIETREASGKGKRKLPKPIVLDHAWRSTQSAAKEHANVLVAMAQAEACELMGEHKQALAFAERHL